jgi:hypothetical protein
MKAQPNWMKESIDPTSSLLNQTQADPLKGIGKSLHIIYSDTPYSCIMVLKDSK